MLKGRFAPNQIGMPLPKPRLPENKGLPTRWRHTRNAYYYQVPPGQEAAWDGKKTFKLGTTLSGAYTEWAKRLGSLDQAKTVGQLLDRYALEVVPTKAAKSRTENARYITNLRNAFGDTQLERITPQDIYRYIDKRSAKISARREVALLSHAYTKAVEWGYINKHPFKGEVRLAAGKPRTRYVEDSEIIECLKLSPMRKRGSVRAVQAYIKLKLLTGLRRGDLLRLQESSLSDEGIRVDTHKTGKPVIYEWTDELRAVIAEVKAARPIDFSPYLFCNRHGQGYMNEKTGVPEGWATMWQGFMKRVLAETKVKERFTEHDLRAKCASDADTLEHARALLAHADSNTTRRVYRRKVEKVRPLR